MTQKPLTEDERRDGAEETMASWALEGMYPTAEDKAVIRQYVSGELTAKELLAAARAEYGLA